MKMLVILILLVPGLLAALEIDWSGELRTRGVYVHNKDLDASTSGKVAIVDTRLRLWIAPKIRDDLKIVFGIEVGDVSWGEEVGSFTLDNNLGKASGGAQGTDGVNIETKHAWMEWSPQGTTLRIGLMPFAAPCQMVIDSDMAAASVQWTMLGLEWTALYARAFAGPRGNGIPTAVEDASQADKSADIVNLKDDRNDYYLAATWRNGKKLALTGWLLLDDNGRFSEYAPGTQPTTESLLFYSGVSAKGRIKKTLQYEMHGVLNTGKVNGTGMSTGSYNVFAWALHGKGEFSFSATSALGLNLRSLSGNEPGSTSTIHQFQVLDGGDGDAGSLLSLLFGGGPFNHQSMFYHKTATARIFNATTGYPVVNDPGITSFEVYFEQFLFDKKLRIRLIAGYAMTTRAITGGERSLGTEVDLALRYRPNKNLEFFLTFAGLLPGKALGPVLALDNDLYSPDRNFGDDPAFKVETMARVRF